MLDAVDPRILKDVRNGTNRVIDLPEEIGGFPNITMGMPPSDSDRDGMPDVRGLHLDIDITLRCL